MTNDAQAAFSVKPPVLVICLCTAVTTPLEKGIPVIPGNVRHSVKYRHHAGTTAKERA